MNIANNREEFGAVTPENEMKVRRMIIDGS